MIQLLLETATDVCSVAVAREGVIVAEQTAAEVHQHSSHLTLLIQEVMRKATLKMTDLDEVVLSDGPGSYTSLRVGAATAKGLCMALPGLKLRVVPTLTALAVAAGPTEQPVLAVINSRRGEVYGQLFLAPPIVPMMARTQVQGNVFGKQGIPASLHPLVLGPTNLRLTEANWFDNVKTAASTADLLVVGPGQQRVTEHLPPGVKVSYGAPLHCSSVQLLAPAAAPECSAAVEVASYEPFYLNAPFVTKSKKNLLG